MSYLLVKNNNNNNDRAVKREDVLPILPKEREEEFIATTNEFIKVIKEMELDKNLEETTTLNITYLLAFIKLSTDMNYNYTSQFLTKLSHTKTKIDILISQIKNNILGKIPNNSFLDYRGNLAYFLRDFDFSYKVFSKFEVTFDYHFELKDNKTEENKKTIWLLFLNLKSSLVSSSSNFVEIAKILVCVFIKYIRLFPRYKKEMMDLKDKRQKKRETESSGYKDTNNNNNNINSNNVDSTMEIDYDEENDIEEDHKLCVNAFKNFIFPHLGFQDNTETNVSIQNTTVLINRKIENLKLNNKIESLLNHSKRDDYDSSCNIQTSNIMAFDYNLVYQQTINLLHNNYDANLKANQFNETLLMLYSQADRSPVKMQNFFKNTLNRNVAVNLNNLNNNNSMRSFNNSNSFRTLSFGGNNNNNTSNNNNNNNAINVGNTFFNNNINNSNVDGNVGFPNPTNPICSDDRSTNRTTPASNIEANNNDIDSFISFIHNSSNNNNNNHMSYLNNPLLNTPLSATNFQALTPFTKIVTINQTVLNYIKLYNKSNLEKLLNNQSDIYSNSTSKRASSININNTTDTNNINNTSNNNNNNIDTFTNFTNTLSNSNNTFNNSLNNLRNPQANVNMSISVSNFHAEPEIIAPNTINTITNITNNIISSTTNYNNINNAITTLTEDPYNSLQKKILYYINKINSELLFSTLTITEEKKHNISRLVFRIIDGLFKKNFSCFTENLDFYYSLLDNETKTKTKKNVISLLLNIINNEEFIKCVLVCAFEVFLYIENVQEVFFIRMCEYLKIDVFVLMKIMNPFVTFDLMSIPNTLRYHFSELEVQLIQFILYSKKYSKDGLNRLRNYIDNFCVDFKAIEEQYSTLLSKATNNTTSSYSSIKKLSEESFRFKKLSSADYIDNKERSFSTDEGQTNTNLNVNNSYNNIKYITTTITNIEDTELHNQSLFMFLDSNNTLSNTSNYLFCTEKLVLRKILNYMLFLNKTLCFKMKIEIQTAEKIEELIRLIFTNKTYLDILNEKHIDQIVMCSIIAILSRKPLYKIDELFSKICYMYEKMKQAYNKSIDEYSRLPDNNYLSVCKVSTITKIYYESFIPLFEKKIMEIMLSSISNTNNNENNNNITNINTNTNDDINIENINDNIYKDISNNNLDINYNNSFGRTNSNNNFDNISLKDNLFNNSNIKVKKPNNNNNMNNNNENNTENITSLLNPKESFINNFYKNYSAYSPDYTLYYQLCKTVFYKETQDYNLRKGIVAIRNTNATNLQSNISRTSHIAQLFNQNDNRDNRDNAVCLDLMSPKASKSLNPFNTPTFSNQRNNSNNNSNNNNNLSLGLASANNSDMSPTFVNPNLSNSNNNANLNSNSNKLNNNPNNLNSDTNNKNSSGMSNERIQFNNSSVFKNVIKKKLSTEYLKDSSYYTKLQSSDKNDDLNLEKRTSIDFREFVNRTSSSITKVDMNSNSSLLGNRLSNIKNNNSNVKTINQLDQKSSLFNFKNNKDLISIFNSVEKSQNRDNNNIINNYRNSISSLNNNSEVKNLNKQFSSIRKNSISNSNSNVELKLKEENEDNDNNCKNEVNEELKGNESDNKK